MSEIVEIAVRGEAVAAALAEASAWARAERNIAAATIEAVEPDRRPDGAWHGRWTVRLRVEWRQAETLELGL